MAGDAFGIFQRARFFEDKLDRRFWADAAARRISEYAIAGRVSNAKSHCAKLRASAQAVMV